MTDCSAKMEPSPTADLSEKYQKLASEYKKAKTQLSVLKKAITQEQENNGELKENVKEKNQTIRKLEQEVESLNFRNEQLAKRVEILQTELNVQEEKGKKNKKLSHAESGLPNRGVLDAELQSKIEENKKLHMLVFEAEANHKQSIQELSQRIEALENENTRLKNASMEFANKNSGHIGKLIEEKALLEARIKNYEKEVKDYHSKEGTYEEQLTLIKSDLGVKLDDVTKTINEKIPFIDTSKNSLNSLNVPTVVKEKETTVKIILGELGEILSEVISRLSDLHVYFEQRVQLTINGNADCDNIGPLSKLVSHLHNHTSYLKPMDVAINKWILSVTEGSPILLDCSQLTRIFNSISKYVNYLSMLMPYIVLCLNCESSSYSTKRITDVNSRLELVARNAESIMRKIEKYLHALSSVGMRQNGEVHPSNWLFITQQLLNSLTQLLSCFEAAKKHFSEKLYIEEQLPIISKDMRTTNECILSCLVSLVNDTSKICLLIENHRLLFENGVPLQPRGILSPTDCSPMTPEYHYVIDNYKKRGGNLIKILNKTSPTSEGVPHKVAVQNKIELENTADDRGIIKSRLSAYEQKITKLEQEKEHWMLDFQLLQAKYERDTKRLQNMGSITSSPSADAISETRTSPSTSSYGTPMVASSSPSLSRKSTESQESTVEADEQVTSYLKSRINHLVAQLQMADSKSVAFYTECASLQQKLQLAKHSQSNNEGVIQNAQGTIQRLKEELDTTVKSYEDQLSTMSEHMANMNETLTTQKDEIDCLRQQANTKPQRKFRGK